MPVADELEILFEEMVALQRKKVLGMAHRLDPSLTEDDVQQPHDFPVLATSPEWNYEDGLLAGYLAAQMAVRAHFIRKG
jgi:hypothetical protein